MSMRSIWWINGQGQATCDGVVVVLPVAPRLPGVAVVELEYIPWVKRRWICYDAQGNLLERDMTDAECQLIDMMLNNMRDAARQVFA